VFVGGWLLLSLLEPESIISTAPWRSPVGASPTIEDDLGCTPYRSTTTGLEWSMFETPSSDSREGKTSLALADMMIPSIQPGDPDKMKSCPYG
jgi:hypothetical protein